jgi:hypothetical protein
LKCIRSNQSYSSFKLPTVDDGLDDSVWIFDTSTHHFVTVEFIADSWLWVLDDLWLAHDSSIFFFALCSNPLLMTCRPYSTHASSSSLCHLDVSSVITRDLIPLVSPFTSYIWSFLHYFKA